MEIVVSGMDDTVQINMSVDEAKRLLRTVAIHLRDGDPLADELFDELHAAVGEEP